MSDMQWIRPAIFGAAAGMAAVAFVGFFWGGWETGRSSSKRAATESRAAVVAAMVPVCLDRSSRDPSRDARLALLAQASSTTRRDLMMDTGWATMPGAAGADRDIAQACLDALAIKTP